MTGGGREMKVTQLYLDLDGVLVNLVDGLIQYHNLPFTHDDVTSWDISNKAGMPRKEFWDDLPNFFWANLEPYPWFYEFKDYFAPYNPFILTSPCSCNGSGKQMWIQEHMPEYFYPVHKKRYALITQKQICSAPGRVLIDDSEDNCEAWENEGGTAILYPRTWNFLRGKSDNAWEYLKDKWESLIEGE